PDLRAEVKLDPQPLEGMRFRRQRLPDLAVGRDRVPNEPAGLLALVEDRDRVAACRELAGADEAGGAGADYGDPAAVARRGLPKLGHMLEGPVGRIALQRCDRDRALKDAGPFAHDFDRADARTGSAE